MVMCKICKSSGKQGELFLVESFEQGLENAICARCIQPERLSEKTYYRNEDGTYPHLEPCIGSDSLNSMET